MRRQLVYAVCVALMVLGCSRGSSADDLQDGNGGADASGTPSADGNDDDSDGESLSGADLPAPSQELRDDAVISYRETGLETWVEQAGSAEEASPCSKDQTVLTVAQFESARAVGDTILAELVLNADAALRNLQVGCERSDQAVIDTEWADLRRTLDLITLREEMLGL